MPNPMKKVAFFQTLTQRLMDVVILLMLTVAVVIALAGILYSIRAGWGLYQATAVGENFLNRQGAPGLVQFADAVNILALAIKTTALSLGVSLSMAVLSRFLGLSSQVYINKGLAVRVFLWGVPIAWLTAWILQEAGMHHSLLILFCLALLPALSLLDRSFRLVNQLVPEAEMLLSAYTAPARLLECLSRCLSLIFVSTIVSVMSLNLLLGLIESGFSLPCQVESPAWGRIPLDLTLPGMVEVAFTFSLTVFCVCIVPAILAQLFHAVKGFYLPLSGPVKLLVFGPVFVSFSALGICGFNQLEPFSGALLLAIVPTFAIYPALLSQLPDIVPEMGELVFPNGPPGQRAFRSDGCFQMAEAKVEWQGVRLSTFPRFFAPCGNRRKVPSSLLPHFSL